MHVNNIVKKMTMSSGNLTVSFCFTLKTSEEKGYFLIQGLKFIYLELRYTFSKSGEAVRACIFGNLSLLLMIKTYK